MPLPALSQTDVALAIAALGTGAAAVIDLRTRRVPNLLTASLAVVGIGLAGAGFGRVGIGASVLGILVGVTCMLPGHIFGATGAGDVKLLGAAGALLGPVDIVKAFICTALAGGVVALLVAFNRGRLQRTFETVGMMVARRPAGDVAFETPGPADNRFAYAPAIAIGVIVAAFGW